MSLLKGKSVFAFHNHIYPFIFCLFAFLFMAELQVNKKIDRDRKTYNQLLTNNKDLKGDISQLSKEYSQLSNEQNELETIIETTYDGQGIMLYKLGEFYYSEERYDKAAKWYNIAGQAKDDLHVSKYVRLAQRRLGICYEEGLGVQSDNYVALKWYVYSNSPFRADSYYDYKATYRRSESGILHDADTIIPLDF